MSRRLVIIPVHNEEEHIVEIMCEIRTWYRGDVLAINDGSTDRSTEILDRMAEGCVKLITHKKNLGYGASLIAGFDFAIAHGYESVVTMDCDWQHEPHYVPAFFEALAEADVVSGSRYLKDMGNGTPPPPDRRAINQKITELVNRVTNYGITDSFCGFKGIRVDALKKLKLTEPGYAFPMQFWVQAWHFGLSVKELCVPRIYLDLKRSFGGQLDDPDFRYRHYQEVFQRELEKWQRP